MAVTDFFFRQIATELVKQLYRISLASSTYQNTAEQLITLIEKIYPTVMEIRYSDVELSALRQAQIGMLFETLKTGKKLTEKLLRSRQWNSYRHLTLARKMEKLEKTMCGRVPLLLHILADIHCLQAAYNVRQSSSSSSSFLDSYSTSSLVTPSLEFPDRISFRKMSLSEAGPSGTPVDRKTTEATRLESTNISNFSNPKDMVLVTSWMMGQLLGRRSFGSIYERISVDEDIFAVNEVSILDHGSQAQEYCIQELEAEIALLSQFQRQNIISSSSSSVDSTSTCSFMTPSLEFPDRISFRKMDLSEAGPSCTLADRKTKRAASLSWIKGQLLGRGSVGSVY